MFLAHLGKASKWINQHRQLPFSNFPTTDITYKYRFELYEYVIQTENLAEEAINYLEFGVHAGGSFRWWLSKLKNKASRFIGFDTFQGLPEDWGPFKAGHFGGVDIPEVNDDRASFVQGLFQQTLHDFLSNFDNSNRTIVHIDADLYSSTLFALTQLTPIFKPGDIILFDEFNVPNHEIKAFGEWVESFYISYEVLGEVNNYFQVAIKLK